MILIALLLFLLALGTPLFVVLGAAALLCFALYVDGYSTFWSLDLLPKKMADLTHQNVFLAIPFFVLSGAIMSAGGISRRLVALAAAMVGWMRGGMAIASIAACMIFASISGSAPVTLIAIGGLMYPAMVKAGYKERFALGLVTSAGSLGMLVPPSVPMLIYAISVTGTSMVNVSELFMSGLAPAVLISVLLSIYSYAVSGYVPREGSFSFAALGKAFREGFWALMLPALILGGIYTGTFTATEAAAVSVPYALFVEFVIHRELKFNQLPTIVMDSVKAMGAIVMIIMLSMGLNQFMVENELGEALLTLMKSWGLGPIGFMIAMNIFLLLIGMVMDSISAIVLFTPLLVPAAVALGFDPLHIGIVFIINMEIGYMMPPVAANLFVAATLFKKPFGEVTRAVIPTVGILIVGLFLVAYVPTLSTGPVYAMKGESFVRPFVLSPQVDEVKEQLVEVKDKSGSGEVLSLEEMMRRAREGGDSEASNSPQSQAAGKVLSLEEMMRMARDSEDGDEVTDAAKAIPAQIPSGKVMSLEEMMRLAKDGADSADTGDSEAGPSAGIEE